MKIFCKLSLMYFIVMLSGCASTATAPDLDKKVLLLLEKTGLKAMIDFIPVQLQSEITQLKITQPNSEEAQFATKTIFKHLTADKMQSAYQKYMVSNLKLDLVEAVLAETNKPLFDRITKAEVASADPKNQGEMVTFINGLVKNSPSDQRIEIMQRIEEVSQSSALVKYMLEQIMRGMNGVLDNFESNKKDLSKEIALMKSMVDSQMKPQMIMQLHYAYRDISDAELNEYIELMKSTDFQKFIIVAVSGIGYIMLDAFQKGAKELKALGDAKAA